MCGEHQCDCFVQYKAAAGAESRYSMCAVCLEKQPEASSASRECTLSHGRPPAATPSLAVPGEGHCAIPACHQQPATVDSVRLCSFQAKHMPRSVKQIVIHVPCRPLGAVWQW